MALENPGRWGAQREGSLAVACGAVAGDSGDGSL